MRKCSPLGIADGLVCGVPERADKPCRLAISFKEGDARSCIDEIDHRRAVNRMPAHHQEMPDRGDGIFLDPTVSLHDQPFWCSLDMSTESGNNQPWYVQSIPILDIFVRANDKVP